jgi:Cys-tRNA(Pro)/Cys-tRNA(Cys) deacylase
MDSESPAIRFLADQGIPFKLFVHQGPVESLEQAAMERGETPDQVVRSILFRLATDEYAMALMPGPKQISWKALRKHFNINRLSLAPNEEVLSITGYPIGAVNPFGLNRPMKILIDQSIKAQKEISLGSGIRGIAIIISVDVLIQALPDAEILDLGPGSDQEISSGGR